MKRICKSLVEHSLRDYVLWAIEEMCLRALLVRYRRPADHQETAITQATKGCYKMRDRGVGGRTYLAARNMPLDAFSVMTQAVLDPELT